MSDMLVLRPHHLIDILTDFDPDCLAEPAQSGNGVHMVERLLIQDLDCRAEFVLGADSICRPCRHLQSDGSCERVLSRFEPPVPMDEYNNALDARLFAALDMRPGDTLSLRDFADRVADCLTKVEAAYAYPESSLAERRRGLEKGLARLHQGSTDGSS